MAIYIKTRGGVKLILCLLPFEGVFLSKKRDKKQDLPIIVIGTGSVGVRFVNEFLYRQPGVFIKVFGGEEQQPYSRENLSRLLAGELTKDSIYSRHKLHSSKTVRLYLNNPVAGIDPKKQTITDSEGEVHAYKKLVLATGSSPLMLDIEGNDLKHVFTFRNIHDAEILKSRQITSRRTVVIGGGLVGLDAAYAMQQYHTDVIVVEKSKRLMSQLLDDRASVYLRLYLNDLGIEVRNQSHVVSIQGKSKVEKIILDNGDEIDCDTVIISIGINPNTDLAEAIGLKINRGIIVNDQLETSENNIYAIGECAEHRDRVYGIVQPGYDQAGVLAKILAGGKAKYTGTITSSKLGVIKYPILSIGDVVHIEGRGYQEVSYRNIKRMIYRKLVLDNGHLRGVVSAGPWRGSQKLYELVEMNKYLWPWQRKYFEKTGTLKVLKDPD